MASYAEMEHRRVIREQKAEARRQEAITQFGEILGRAYLSYTGDLETMNDYAQRRRDFAQTVVSALENGTYEEKIRGVEVLLCAFEAKIAPVARQASTTAALTARY